MPYSLNPANWTLALLGIDNYTGYSLYKYPVRPTVYLGLAEAGSPKNIHGSPAEAIQSWVSLVTLLSEIKFHMHDPALHAARCSRVRLAQIQ